MRVRQSLAGRLCIGSISLFMVATSAGCAAQGADGSGGNTYESTGGERNEVLGISVRADGQELPANIKPADTDAAAAQQVDTAEVLGATVSAASPVTTATSLAPGLPARNQELEPTLRSGAALFAGTTIAQFTTPTSTELSYWAQSNVVVATVNHALAGGPAADWTAQALQAVELTRSKFWAPAVVERFARSGTDWSSSGPSLVIIDEANNVEIMCSAQAMIGFAALGSAVSSQNLIDGCLR